MNILGGLGRAAWAGIRATPGTVRGVGGISMDVGRHGLDISSHALSSGRRVLFEPAENFLGFRPRKTTVIAGAIGLPAAAGGIGFVGGRRDANLGYVDTAPMTGMTPTAMQSNSPNIRNVRRPHFHDDLGADGQLALALHHLRGG